MNDTSINKEIIVLAAGKGSRMGPDLPKVLVPFNNQTMIDHVLEQVYQTGEQQPLIVVGHQSTAVENHCGSSCRYVLQEEQRGTGHAVLVTEDNLKDNTEYVLVVYGDQPLVSSGSMKKMFYPLEVGIKLVLATAVIHDDDMFNNHFYHYGRIIRDDKGAITKIAEAKDATEDERGVREINVGFMAFDRKWGYKNLHTLTTDNAQGEYYLTDLVSHAFRQGLEIDSVQLSQTEALGANTPEQLAVMESHT